MIVGSNHKFLTTVRLDDSNCCHNVWYCERQQEWRWSLVWEDGSPSFGTHMHSGSAPTQDKARADIVATMLWVEDKWPSEEYFTGA